MSRDEGSGWTRHCLLSLAFVLCAGAAALAADPTVVTQKGRAFGVKDVRIERGGTIPFYNDDDFVHQIFVQSPGFSYESDEQQPGQAMDVVFPSKDTFDVQCHIHPRMHLRVDVP